MKFLSLLLALCLGSAAFGQVEECSYHPAGVSYAIDGMHRSDVLPNGFLRTFLVGGLLEPVELEGIRNRMEGPGVGHLGVAAGHALVWHGLVGPSGRVPRVSLASRGLMSAGVAGGLFSLVFQGNAPDLGQARDLALTRVRWLQWNRLAFGLGNADGTSFVDVGLYHAAWGADGVIESGAFYVSEGVDALAVGLDAEASFWDRAGWGLGLDFRHQWGEEQWWALEVQDLGVVRYGTGERAVADTGLVTTGLPWSGPGWTVEGVQEEGFGEERSVRKRVGEGWQVLPARGTVRAGTTWSNEWAGEAALTWGGWMPRPRLDVRAAWSPRAEWGVELGAIAGGWGLVRPVVGVSHATANGRWALVWDDPVGSLSANGLGRGASLVWSRNW